LTLWWLGEIIYIDGATTNEADASSGDPSSRVAPEGRSAHAVVREDQMLADGGSIHAAALNSIRVLDACARRTIAPISAPRGRAPEE
jgi:hypothetical protein